MKYNRLGNTGLQVSELCFGTMTFSGANFLGGVVGKQTQTEATQLIGRALEARINFIDTANVYALGESETMTGQALKDVGAVRSDVVIASKVFGRMAPGPNDIGASRGHIMDSIGRSLERLQTDHIDLYQIHQSDIATGVEETMRALDDLVRQDMVRYIGVSNWEAWKIMKANGIADKRGWTRIETNQAYYSLAGRDIEQELVPLMADQQIGCLVWSPLAGGYMAGKYTPGGEAQAPGRRAGFDFPPIDKDQADRIVLAMRPIAAMQVAVGERITRWERRLASLVVSGSGIQIPRRQACARAAPGCAVISTVDAIGDQVPNVMC